MALGLPFNTLWSALLIDPDDRAEVCDLEPGELVWNGGDVHLYSNHAALVEEQLTRVPAGAPRDARNCPPARNDLRFCTDR
ncbi:MAG: thymidylate synthase [Parasphingorhabdus sp.]|nr:thymidylate synthase [Parasphingorhabdus sp.]